MFELLLVVASLGTSPGTANPIQEAGGDVAVRSARGLELEELVSPAGPKSVLPNLARGADGQVYLSWIDRTVGDVSVMRFSVLKESQWGKPVEIIRGQDLFLNWADFPSVCALESGVLIAQWLREGENPHGYTAEFSISSDQGRTWTSPQTLHDDASPAEHGFVSIVPIDSDTFGAIWLDGRRTVGKAHGEGETGLYFRAIAASGKLGVETVLDPRVCDCCQTSLVATSRGGLLATYRDRTADEVRDISLVRFDGRTWSEPAPVHMDGWLIAGCPVNGPRVASENGTTSAAWFTGVGEGGGSVLVGFQGPTSTGFGLPIDVDDGRAVGRVDVVFSEDESVVVSWMEHAGEAGAQWRARRLWKDGQKGDSITVGRVSSDRTSGSLRMVSTGADMVLAWTSSGPESQVETARLHAK